MNNQLATGYIVCLSCGVILSVWFLLREVRTQRRWELAAAVFSSISQIVSSIFTIVTLAVTFNPSFQLDWVDLAVVCTLQAIVCTNVSYFTAALLLFNADSFPASFDLWLFLFGLRCCHTLPLSLWLQ